MSPAGGAFDPLRSLALALVLLLILDVGLAWVAVQAGFNFVHLVWLALAHRLPPELGLDTFGRQFAVLRMVQGGAWVLTAVVFLRWVRRAQRNLEGLAVSGRVFIPTTAVTAFLRPPANLVRPLAVVSELWGASDPRAPEGAVWRPRRPPLRIVLWWLLVVGALGLDVGVTVASLVTGSVLARGLLGPFAIGECAKMAAGSVAIAIVLSVQERQDDRRRRLRRARGEEVAR